MRKSSSSIRRAFPILVVAVIAVPCITVWAQDNLTEPVYRVANETATTPATTPATTTAAAGGLGQVQVRVLGAILRPAGTPEGQQRRRARLTMRVQAVNEADEAVTIGRPVLGVGKVRINTDAAAETADEQLGELAAGTTKAVTLRFELAGEATEKITIDRRARINIAGRSLPFRVKVGSPVIAPATTP